MSRDMTRTHLTVAVTHSVNNRTVEQLHLTVSRPPLGYRAFIACTNLCILGNNVPVLMAIFPGRRGLAGTRVSVLDFIGAADDERAGNNWSYKTCKAPVRSFPSTNQHWYTYRRNSSKP